MSLLRKWRIVFAASPLPSAGFKFSDQTETGGCFVGEGDKAVATLKCIPCFMENIVNFGLIMAGATAAFFIVFAGWKFISSGGDPIKAASAKKVLTFAGAGLVIVLLSYSILNFAGKSFGITFFQQCG